MKKERTEFEKEFERETGLSAWIPTYSEKFQENREYLNPEYSKWVDEKIQGILNKHTLNR